MYSATFAFTGFSEVEELVHVRNRCRGPPQDSAASKVGHRWEQWMPLSFLARRALGDRDRVHALGQVDRTAHVHRSITNGRLLVRHDTSSRIRNNRAMSDHEEHPAEKGSEPARANRRLRRLLGILSALVSLACLVVLAVSRTRVYTAPPTPQPADHVVTTPDEVSRYLKAYFPSSQSSSNPPIFIPTGIYLGSMRFKGPYNVQMSGYVWQRYANDVPRISAKASSFPKASTRGSKVYSGRQE